MRRQLKMQAAQHTFLCGIDVIVLNERHGGLHLVAEQVRPKCFGKKATLIPVLFRGQKQQSGDSEPFDVHNFT
jgi:hypothetical protein